MSSTISLARSGGFSPRLTDSASRSRRFVRRQTLYNRAEVCIAVRCFVPVAEPIGKRSLRDVKGGDYARNVVVERAQFISLTRASTATSVCGVGIAECRRRSRLSVTIIRRIAPLVLCILPSSEPVVLCHRNLI